MYNDLKQLNLQRELFVNTLLALYQTENSDDETVEEHYLIGDR